MGVLRGRSWCTAMVAVVVLSGGLMASDVSFTPLGDLPGGAFESGAFGVSADGSVVVGGGASPGASAGSNEAFRWTAGTGMQGLGSLGGPGAPSGAQGVSPDGQFIVGLSSSPRYVWEAFRLGPDGVMTGLGALATPAPFQRSSEARAVSRDGAVVVGRSLGANGDEGFRWTAAGGMVGLGDLPGGEFHSEAIGVSADGSVIVGAGTVQVPGRIFSVTRGFRWTAQGGMQALPGVSGSAEEAGAAVAVSADGNVIVGYGADEQGRRVAVRWVGGSAQNIGQLGDVGTVALATNADGSVVTGRTDNLDDIFLWDPANGMQSVTALLRANGALPDGWRLQWGAALSADGRTLVGFGRNADNFQEAFVITLPEPTAAAAIFAIAYISLSRRRARRAA